MKSKTRKAAGKASLDPLVRLLIRRAEGNIAKWGAQGITTLGLAVAEEAGELAQAILKWKYEQGHEDRIRDEAIDLGALCLQTLLWVLHRPSEDARPNAALTGGEAVPSNGVVGDSE